MCNLCQMPECTKENPLHYPGNDHSKFTANLFPGNCGVTVVWGFYGLAEHTYDAKVEELKQLEAEAKNRHHVLLVVTAFDKDINTRFLEEMKFVRVHSYGSKYGHTGLGLWCKDLNEHDDDDLDHDDEDLDEEA